MTDERVKITNVEIKEEFRKNPPKILTPVRTVRTIALEVDGRISEEDADFVMEEFINNDTIQEMLVGSMPKADASSNGLVQYEQDTAQENLEEDLIRNGLPKFPRVRPPIKYDIGFCKKHKKITVRRIRPSKFQKASAYLMGKIQQTLYYWRQNSIKGYANACYGCEDMNIECKRCHLRNADLLKDAEALGFMSKKRWFIDRKNRIEKLLANLYCYFARKINAIKARRYRKSKIRSWKEEIHDGKYSENDMRGIPPDIEYISPSDNMSNEDISRVWAGRSTIFLKNKENGVTIAAKLHPEDVLKYYGEDYFIMGVQEEKVERKPKNTAVKNEPNSPLTSAT